MLVKITLLLLWGRLCTCSSLWAQLSAVQASDSTDATRAAKTQFLQKLQLAVSLLARKNRGFVALNLQVGEGATVTWQWYLFPTHLWPQDSFPD